jgi:hypothetical protein
MCTFITAIVPAETALLQLRELCGKHGFSADPVDNASLRTLMPQGYQFLPVGGSCNCDTALGFAHRPTSQSHDLEGDISKLKRKGWTAAKIERWRKEKEQARQQKQQQPYIELRRWKDWIAEIVRAHSAKRLTIVLHFYKDGIDTDRIQIKRLEKIDVDTLNVDQLALLDWDVLYQFSRCSLSTSAPSA